MPRPLTEHRFSADMCLPMDAIKLFCDENDPRFDAEKMKKVTELAEKELEADIPLCPASLYYRFAKDGNRTEYEAVYFRRREMILRLALAEAYEKKGRFTEKLMDAVWAVMEESSWTVPAHLAMYSPSHGDLGLPAAYDGERLHAIDLFSAATAALLALVYRYCKESLDGITPVICEKLKYLVNERQLKPFINCAFHWSGLLGNPVNNWNPWVMSNILFAAAILAKDDYSFRLIVDKAVRSADNYTKFVADDGGCDEGPSYWRVAGASFFDTLEILYDITGGKYELFDDAFVRSMCEYICKAYVHGNRYLNFADCPPYVYPDGSQISRMGRKCKSELLSVFGDTVAMFGDVRLETSNPYRTLRNLITPPHAAKESRAAKRVWMPCLKIMAVRENEETGKGMFVAMKGGHNAEGHNHIDVGNVVVYKDGEPVLIDTGCGAYSKKTFSAHRYELWYMQSGYHNVADVGGFTQRAGGAYRSCDEVYDESTGGVSMQLKNAYPAEAGIVSYVRETALKEGVVFITDGFELTEEKEIDIHFITHRKPTVRKDVCEIDLAQGCVMTYDGALTAGVEEFDPEDGRLQSVWGSPVLYRIHLTAKTAKGSFTVTVR